MNRVEVTAPGKLAALLVVLIGCFTYIIAVTVSGADADTTPAWATLTLVVGYLVGNGVGAKAGVQTIPPLSPKSDT